MIELAAYFPRQAVGEYLLGLFAVGFGAMVWDKLSAWLGVERISERSLALVALAGGFSGVIAGGLIVHHKTSKPEFWVPVACATVIWGIFLIAYFVPSVLG